VRVPFKFVTRHAAKSAHFSRGIRAPGRNNLLSPGMQLSEIIALAWSALFVIAVRILTGDRSLLTTGALWFVAGSIATVFAISLAASF
jgi:hypothetical protein